MQTVANKILLLRLLLLLRQILWDLLIVSLGRICHPTNLKLYDLAPY